MKKQEPTFSILDLVPKDAPLVLSTHPGKTFTLCRWSLRVRAWAIAQYGYEGLKTILEKQMIGEIADMAWFMLIEKDQFENDKNKFLDAVVTNRDQLALINALNATIGIGEPEVKQIIAKVESEKKSQTQKMKPPPLKKTGLKPSTP